MGVGHCPIFHILYVHLQYSVQKWHNQHRLTSTNKHHQHEHQGTSLAEKPNDSNRYLVVGGIGIHQKRFIFDIAGPHEEEKRFHSVLKA